VIPLIISLTVTPGLRLSWLALESIFAITVMWFGSARWSLPR
jgi:hypothetical protein